MGFVTIDKQTVLEDLSYLIEAHKNWQRRFSNNQSKLHLLLEHARKTVPYFRQQLDHHTAPLSLDAFPIVSNETYNNTSQMLSDAFEREDLIWHTSSGKTGRLLRLALDHASAYGCRYDMRRVQAERINTIHFKNGELGIIQLVDKPNKQGHTRIIPSLNHSFCETLILDQSQEMNQQLIQYLRNAQMQIISGRPRSLMLLQELDKQMGGGKINPGAIKTSGDNLHPESKQLLEHWFNCSVYNAYQCQEGGSVAMDCIHQNGMHLFNDKVVVEVLNKNNAIVKEGNGKAIITNLENWAMPFIRFRKEDEITLKWTECPCGYQGYSIFKLKGSESCFFKLNGTRFNPSLFNIVFENLNLTQYQVTQTNSKQLYVKWIPHKGNSSGQKITETIIQKIAAISHFAPSNIQVEKVEAIVPKKNHRVERYLCLV